MSKIGGDLDLGNTASVPGIELADLNDGDIISATRKLSDDGGATISMAYTLPSGQEIKSQPVQADLIGKAMFQWLDFVKEQIVAEGRGPELAAREAQLKQQRDRDWATDGIKTDGPVPTDSELMAAGITARGGQRPNKADYLSTASEPLPSDARGFAKSKLRDAKATVQILRTQIRQREQALKQAELAVAQWGAAVDVLRDVKGIPAKRRRK